MRQATPGTPCWNVSQPTAGQHCWPGAQRVAVEHEWPHPLELEEHSHAAMANAYAAGAAGLPCAIFRGYQGSDLVEVNPHIRFISCPFTGERLAAVPAIRPDLTIIHALR